MSHKQFAIVINEIIDTDTSIEQDIEPVVVEDYKRLSDKCDAVITKINKRKKNNKTQKSGD